MAEENSETVANGLEGICTPWSSGQEVTTILICTNSLLRAGLKHLLANTCFAVSDTAFDEASLLPCCPDATPTLLIVDASHAAGGAVEAVRHLKTQRPEVRVVLIADHFERDAVVAERTAGADGFLLTSTSRDVLIKSLELVMLGQTVLPSAMILAMLDAMTCRSEHPSDGIIANSKTKALDPNARKLSVREAEILDCLKQGAANKVIARQLEVAEATVKVHVKAILRKLGAANRTQAAIWATEHRPPAASGASLHA